jgi:hypothetical protein
LRAAAETLPALNRLPTFWHSGLSAVDKLCVIGAVATRGKLRVVRDWSGLGQALKNKKHNSSRLDPKLLRMPFLCGYFFFSSFLIFFSAFFSFGVLAGAVLDVFLLS